MLHRMLLLLAALLGFAGEARAEWRRAETPYFTIQADLPEAELRTAAAELLTLDTLIRAMTGTNTPPGRRKTQIVMLDDVQTARQWTGLDAFVGGVTMPTDMGEIILVARHAPEWGEDYDPRRSLFHEYSHGFMRQYLAALQPGWFVEGFASYFETAVPLPGGGIRYGARPAGYELAYVGNSFRFESIMAMAAERRDGPPPTELYIQGWVLTHHYFQGAAHGTEIRSYLDAVHAARPVSAPEKFFAGGIPSFDSDMTAYLNAIPPERVYAAPPVDPASIAIRPMRPGEARFIELRLTEIATVRGARSKRMDAVQPVLTELYTRARTLLGQYPDEAELGHFTATRALMSGETAAADALADKLLAATPDDPDLLALKADILTELAKTGDFNAFPGRIARGRALLQRAQAIDPQNPDAAAALYRNYSADEGPSPAARRYLARAIELSPGDFELRMSAVEYALRNGDVKAAIALLEPPANSPHDSPERQTAIRAIAELKKRR